MMFRQELERSPFTIFEQVSDLGFFTWIPKGGYRPLGKVQNSQEFFDQIDLNGMPRTLIDPSSLALPSDCFSNALEPQEHVSTYPYSQMDVLCLHLATKHRGLELNTVDFCFGGTTLEMLASQDASNASYLVTCVPGATNVILVVRRKDYTQDYSNVGFQFERLMTGRKCTDLHDVKFVEHLQVMQIGRQYRVLLRAETDAQYEGEPVEIKASNPAYFGTRVMFQMISNGSPRFCHGVKSYGTLHQVNLTTLGDVTRDALQLGRSASVLEHNILTGMASIKEKMQGTEAGKVFQISFISGGSLQLTPVAETSENTLLPPESVVRELIS